MRRAGETARSEGWAAWSAQPEGGWSLSWVAQCLALAVVYATTARIGQLFAIPPGNITPVWIPSGLMLAALLLRGPRLWPGVFLGALLGNVWAYFETGSSAAATLALFSGTMNGVGDALGTTLGAALLVRACPGLPLFDRSRGAAAFLALGAALPSAISALFGVTSLSLVGLVPWSDYAYTFFTWFSGDAVGVLLLTPAVLEWSRAGERRPGRAAEVAAFALVLAAVSAYCLELFSPPRFIRLPLFALTPLLMWGVFRLGDRVTFTSIPFIAAMSVLVTIRGTGPFAGESVTDALLELQIFLAVMTITVLIFSATVRERHTHQLTVARLNEDLEQRVVERTQALETELAARRAAEDARRELERQILETQKLDSLGMLAGGIAHDYNNMLTVIMSHAELGMMLSSPSDPLQTHFSQILAVADRSAALSRQLLAYSGRGAFRIRPVDLGAEVLRMQDMLRVATSRHVAPIMSVEEGLPQIAADPSQLDQLLLNLALNASDALGDDEGEIAVTVARAEATPAWFEDVHVGSAPLEGPCVRLSVRDTGCGMDEETRRRIFDPFFTTKSANRGLGMAVVIGIVRGHGGAIKVRSVPGEGTEFTVLFPLLAP